MDALQVVVFRLGSQEYAFDIQAVKEIIRVTDITSVPNAENHVKGIINLRGTVTPIISLARRFGLMENEKSEETRIIILYLKEKQIGVIVDSVNEVLYVDQKSIQQTDTGTPVDQSFIQGIGKLDNRLLIILNQEELVTTLQPSL